MIANHSDTHPWLSRTGVKYYLADIDKAEAWLRGMPGLRAWFRFPYLDEGNRDRDKRDAVRIALQDRDLQNAYVTIDRSPAHVLLLHETDLAALFIEDLVDGFRKDGWEIITIDEAYSDPIAAIEPDTQFLGSGRVAAIAHTKGWSPADLVHKRTDEDVLDIMFERQVLNR